MGSQERHEPDSGSGRSWPAGDDVLRDLEARLDRASQAAERLLAEATARAARAGEGPAQTGDAPPEPGDSPPQASDAPPAAGWQAPDRGAPSSGRELELLIGLLGAVRDLVPPELQRRLAEALRELLLAIRALIDWYLERVERRRAEPSDVQDIPIQ